MQGLDVLRKIIREGLRNLFQDEIDEAKMTDHVTIDRFERRFLSPGEKTICIDYGFADGEFKYTEVGTRKITADEIAELHRRMEILKEYNFPRSKSYAVKVYDFIIKPEEVDFYSEDYRQLSKGKNLIFIDKETKSMGNCVYIVIRENMGVTIFFAKNYLKIDAAKFRTDFVIKDFNNIIQKKVY